MRGKASITAAFFDPLPDNELDAWEGRERDDTSDDVS
jgi:hypothetical protein